MTDTLRPHELSYGEISNLIKHLLNEVDIWKRAAEALHDVIIVNGNTTAYEACDIYDEAKKFRG